MPMPCESWPSRFAVTRFSATSRASLASLPPAATTASMARVSGANLNRVSIILPERGRQFRLKTMRHLLLLAAWIAAAAHAQSFPSKPIRLIVPYAAGGTSDILARQIGPKLNDAWSQPVVVENKTGANGNVGADFVAKSAPDGYTLLLTDLGGLVISASVYPKLQFDPSKDFSTVVMVSYSPHVLAVHPSVPVKSVTELIEMAKAQPGKLNFAISGIGGAPQLAGIEFAQRTGIQWTYIPYKGGSDAVTAVVAGQADVLFNGMLATWPSVQGGKLKALAISSAQRVGAAPDTPTVAEQGLPGFETGSFQGVVGPAGMPGASVTKLNSELINVLNSAEMKERFARQGTDVRAGTPESLGQWLRTEQARFARVVKASGEKFE